LAYLGTNPRKQGQLDSLGRTAVILAGVPAPLPPSLSSMPADEARAQILEEASARLKSPRADRKRILEDTAQKLRDSSENIFGTSQVPFMVQIDDDLFTTFVPDLMEDSERFSFYQNWRLRGLLPAELEARKEESVWKYRLSKKWRSL